MGWTAGRTIVDCDGGDGDGDGGIKLDLRAEKRASGFLYIL
jgi:hypothetical protein